MLKRRRRRSEGHFYIENKTWNNGLLNFKTVP
jgi:hypothetical protein